MEKAKINIRYATSADNALLAELGARTFYDAFAADNTPENMAAYLAASFSPEKQAAELADPSSCFLIAEVDGAAVGYAQLWAGKPSEGITGPRPIELRRLYVLQDRIGHGIGAALMQACINEAQQGGYETLWLGVWERNARARAFYRRWGFVEVGTHIFELGRDPQTDLLMQRALTPPTPYPEVNAILHDLLTGVKTILGDHFVGMYLYGSLAIGDFRPDNSDIDFLVVTADELPGEMVRALQALHAHIAASGSKWATELEGSYIPQQALRSYDPAHALHLNIERGEGESLRVKQHESDSVIQRYIVREHGIVLAGPAPHTLIDPISPDELRRAVLDLLYSWWAPMLDDPARLLSPGYRSYAVLTMCRMLYTLQTAAVVSKSVAARWAQQVLGEPWSALIERALAYPHDAQADTLNLTLDFIRCTVERSQRTSEV